MEKHVSIFQFVSLKTATIYRLSSRNTFSSLREGGEMYCYVMLISISILIFLLIWAKLLGEGGGGQWLKKALPFPPVEESQI